MKVHVLQHVPFEDIGSMAAWLMSRGTKASYTRFFENPELPDPDKLEWCFRSWDMPGSTACRKRTGMPCIPKLREGDRMVSD